MTVLNPQADVVDISINWAAGRNWQTKVLDTRKVQQLNLPRQKSIKQPILRHL